MQSCPNCGKPLKSITKNGITQNSCDFCGYCLNENTGEVKQFNRQANTCIVKCPSCLAKIRVCQTEGEPEVKIGDIVHCDFCNTEFTIPEKPDPELFLVVTCLNCQGKSKIPANRGKLLVTCNHCKTEFVHDTGRWPTVGAAPKTNTAPKAAPQPKGYTAPPQREEYEPANQPNPPQSSGSIFKDISNYFKERKASAEDESVTLTDSELTHYIGRTVQNTLMEFRPQIAAYGSNALHFDLKVYKTFCDLYFYYYDSERRFQSKLLLRCEYSKINNIFGWNCFSEIKYREARHWFSDVIYNEYIVKTGFLLRQRNTSDRRIGILRSQL